MNSKKLSVFVFGLLAFQLVMPNYSASEVIQPVAQQAEVKYAPTNPTPAQVRAAAPTDLVNIPDPALEAAIDTTLNLMGEPITVADMESLNIFSIYGTTTSDLTGMEYAINLGYFDCIDNQVTDLSPLSGLTKLTSLNINRNQVSDVTPIAQLPKLTMFSAYMNNISDLTPFAGNSVLQSLMLPSNNITDITPLSGMTALQGVQLNANHISDISPLETSYNNGTLMLADVSSQTVNGPDIVVTTGDEVSFNIIKLDGVKVPIVLGTPTYGANNFADVAFDESGETSIRFNGTITQKVTYVTLTGTEADTINEGTPMTDAQLIELFNVVSAENKAITVDQSAVNYDVPGTYDVVFNNGIDTVTSQLTVKNVAPTITLTTNTVTIKAGETVDYITTFGAVATEFTDGDLTTSITVDDSQVNYDKAGTYTVTLKVTDTDGTEVSTTGTVVIEEDATVTPEDKKSETTESEATESEAASEIKAMTDDNKSLASTGYFTTMILVVLTAMVAMVVTVKKTLMSKN